MSTRNKMILHSYRVRGQMLQLCIELEIRFEDYIAKHLTHEHQKEMELIALVLAPRVTFERKFQIFKYLVDKHNPEFGQKAKKYNTQLPEIIEFRNNFAHYPAVFSEETEKEFEKDGSLSFYKIINQKPTKATTSLISKLSISFEETKKLFKLITAYIKLIDTIIPKDKDAASPPA